jgi:arylformamidase
VRSVRQTDVSMPLFPGMPSFPGDPTFESDRVDAIARGGAYNVSRLALGSHAGTHVDPPLHFFDGAPGMDRLDLDQLNGPCAVVDVDPARSAIATEDLRGVPAGTRRVLFRTANSARWARSLTFFPDYVPLTAEAAEGLLQAGVRVVGIDALSIESDATGTFPIHRRLLGGKALIIEGLLLDAVRPGPYDLVCLPLKIRNGDGGPARVVLRSF